MNNDFTLGIQGTVEPNITFLTNSSKEAMRIDKNGVKVNPDFPMDEAAQYVIKALDEHIKSLILAEREVCANAAMVAAEEAVNLAMALEREACAKVVEESSLPDSYSEACLPEIAAAIRARGNT